MAPAVDVLADWQSIGVIDEVFVISAADSGNTQLPALRINGGRTARVALATELAGRHDVTAFRLALLSVPDRAMLTETQAVELRTLVERAAPRGVVSCLNVVAARPGVDYDVAAHTWLGWHNILLAPENSASPSAGLSLIGTEGPLPVTHTMAAVCSLLGLFAGHRDGRFDGRDYLPDARVVVARGFTRFLAADAVERELLARVADVRERYPVPLYAGNQVLVATDEAAVATGSADVLWQAHGDLHARPRREPQPPPRMVIGAWEALRRFFVFLGYALRNAPGAYLRSLAHRINQRSAAAVQGFVFGQGDSTFAVAVNGVRADGRPVGFEEMDSALDTMTRQAAGRAVQHQPSDLARFWQEFMAGALSLLDAGTRTGPVEPLTVGSSRAVLSSPEHVVAGAGFTLTNNLAGHLPDWQLAPGDVLRGGQLAVQLDQLGRDHPHLAAEAAHAQHGLQGWLAAAERTYAGRLGGLLTRDLLSSVRDIIRYNELLAGLAAPTPPPDDGQRALSRILLGILGGAVLLLVLTVVLAVAIPFKWWVTVIICLVIVTAWLVTSVLVFVNRQRQYFEELHRREHRGLAEEAYRANLLDALDDARRLHRAYRQYQDWTRALGSFLRTPLGTPPPHRSAQVLIGPGLPLNLRLGEATTESIAAQVPVLRRNMFEANWLDHAWNHFRSDLPSGLGEWQDLLRQQPDHLWHDPPLSAAGSVLSHWAQAVHQHERARGIPPSFQHELTSLLQSNQDQVATALREHVRFRANDTGQVGETDYASFVAGLGTHTGQTAAFDGALFAEATSTNLAHQVVDSWPQQAQSGLSYSIIVVQTSAALPPEDLRSAHSQLPTDAPRQQRIARDRRV